ncbi:MAG: DEAD/DEAH box helicase [Anaerolineales bacterium]|nr:DEAD/DEAH box helicase [Anaerolineales bacterium]
MSATLVFDLETKHLAHEVGGWSNIHHLGLSAAVILDVERDQIMRFIEKDAERLIAEILSADRIVGFNLIRFDYEVLRPYGLVPDTDLHDRTTDLLLDIHEQLGFRIALDNLAEATLQIRKSANGLQAVAWYKEGKIDKVLDYCEQDVRVTYQLWEYGKQNGHVLYRDRNFRLLEVAVAWI